MAFTKILVGTDGSDTAALALLCAGGLAHATGAKLLIVTAFEKSQAQDVESLLQTAQIKVLECGVEPTLESGQGSPPDVIVDLAERVLADLIVVGNKGMEGGKRFRLGGVPDQISHRSPCDLLIVRTTDASPQDKWIGRYQKILVATDGSETATEAVRKGVDLASRLSCSVTLLYVGDEAYGEKILRDTVETGATNVNVKTLIVDGDPGKIIPEVAEKETFDLIVVGNKGMTGAKGRLAGSIPNEVSHAAHCDVLIAQTVTKSLADLEPGEGAIVQYRGRKLAAYKQEDGAIFAMSPKCQHLGCTVGWNGDDRTWDCPCHGSRYNFKGEVVEGPATKSLAPEEIEN